MSKKSNTNKKNKKNSQNHDLSYITLYIQHVLSGRLDPITSQVSSRQTERISTSCYCVKCVNCYCVKRVKHPAEVRQLFTVSGSASRPRARRSHGGLAHLRSVSLKTALLKTAPNQRHCLFWMDCTEEGKVGNTHLLAHLCAAHLCYDHDGEQWYLRGGAAVTGR